MLISKFNKLIHNKILWSILAVTIAFFFVGASIMAKMGDGGSNAERAAEGKLFGEEVGGNDFYLARYFELGMRPMADNSEEAIAALRERTWQRVAALRMAEQMGITVTDEDIRDVITQDPTFASNGVFDQRRYLMFLQSRLRIDPTTFEDYLRQDITLRRLMAALRAASWTSPYELTPRLAKLTDRISLEYAVMPIDTETDEVDVSEEDIVACFETYRDAFRIDEQIKVRHISFPVSTLLDAVEVSEADIDDYYNDHIEDYTTVDTNDTEIVEPLDDLHDEIAELVREQKARFEAKDEATRFVMALAPDRYGQAYEMDAAAEARGLTVMTSDWFTAAQEIPGLDAGLDLTRAAFDLVPNDPERYFSDAVSGSNAVYVVADLDRRPARDPELEEVREQVVAAATLQAAEDAFLASVEATRQQLIEAAADTNQGFMATAQELDMMAATTGVFTVYEGLPADAPYNAELISEIIDAREGDVLEATDTADGLLIAHIASRGPGDPSAAELLRPQYVRSMDQYRAAVVCDAWLGQLMSESDFEDYHPITD
jgi:peptidyl-prolyl cis-trans isomerase D